MTELKTDNTVPEFLRTVIGDASAIAEIENVCFTSKWTEKLIIEEISNKNSVSFVCKINNNIVGYIFFRYLFEEGEVLKICVLPSFRKFGIGSSLMKKALEIAYENGVEKVFLEILERKNTPFCERQRDEYGKIGVAHENKVKKLTNERKNEDLQEMFFAVARVFAAFRE